MSSQDKFTLDISSLKRPIRRSDRLNKDVIIWLSYIWLFSFTYIYTL
jgi:hypothetical protein